MEVVLNLNYFNSMYLVEWKNFKVLEMDLLIITIYFMYFIIFVKDLHVLQIVMNN